MKNNLFKTYSCLRASIGFNNDALWMQYILDKLSNDLNVNSGKIYWNAGSLHIYEKHFKYLM